jgi:hypothetical protein
LFWVFFALDWGRFGGESHGSADGGRQGLGAARESL